MVSYGYKLGTNNVNIVRLTVTKVSNKNMTKKIRGNRAMMVSFMFVQVVNW